MIRHAAQGAARDKLARLRAANPGRDIFLMNFQLPGRPGHVSWMLWFAVSDRGALDEQFMPLWEEFRDADDAWRNARLKMMVVMPEGPFLLRKAMPGNKPVIIGKGIALKYFRGEGYLEANVDIASSGSATKMWGMVQSMVTTLVLDIAFIIEAKEAHQLPERLLGAVRCQKCDLGTCPTI